MSFCAPVSPDPLNARSLGFPKSPPLKILDPPMERRQKSTGSEAGVERAGQTNTIMCRYGPFPFIRASCVTDHRGTGGRG